MQRRSIRLAQESKRLSYILLDDKSLRYRTVSLFLIALALFARKELPFGSLFTSHTETSTLSESVSGRRAVIFLKTHKTGSSTVTALILRKCMRDKLNCFIPDRGHPGKTFDLDRDLKEIIKGRGASFV